MTWDPSELARAEEMEQLANWVEDDCPVTTAPEWIKRWPSQALARELVRYLRDRIEEARVDMERYVTADVREQLESRAARVRELETALPDPDKLDWIAKWLDYYDEYVALWFEKNGPKAGFTDAQVAKAAEFARGKTIQNDCTEWAARIRAVLSSGEDTA